MVRAREAAVAAADLVLPVGCASCGGPGGPSGPLCGACRVEVRGASLTGAATAVTPRPRPAGMPDCWASARFEGALRSAVTAYKDEDRRDLRPVLAEGLAVAVTSALFCDPTARRAVAAGERVLVVPVATSRSSRRRRGDDPVGDLAREAAGRVAGSGDVALAVVPVLVHVRVVADQARLGREARRDNLAGALEVTAWGRPVLAGSVCVVVDDVVTTGSTLAEATRALRSAGARHVVAAAVAATPRRSRAPPRTPARGPRARPGAASRTPLVSRRIAD